MGDHPQAPQTIVNVNMANYAPGAAVQDWIPNKRTIAVRGAFHHPRKLLFPALGVGEIHPGRTAA